MVPVFVSSFVWASDFYSFDMSRLSISIEISLLLAGVSAGGALSAHLTAKQICLWVQTV